MIIYKYLLQHAVQTASLHVVLQHDFIWTPVEGNYVRCKQDSLFAICSVCWHIDPVFLLCLVLHVWAGRMQQTCCECGSSLLMLETDDDRIEELEDEAELRSIKIWKEGEKNGDVTDRAASLHRCLTVPEKPAAHQGDTTEIFLPHTASWSKTVCANCWGIPLGLCYCTAPSAFWLQLKNLCEDCIHPIEVQSCVRASGPGLGLACDYLLFQLFPRLTLWVGEWCVCACGCWLGAGSGGEVKWDGGIRSSGMEEKVTEEVF